MVQRGQWRPTARRRREVSSQEGPEVDAGRAATAKLARQLAADYDMRVVELARKDLNDVLVHDGIDALKRTVAGERIDSPT